MLDIQHLTKTYGDKKAVDDLTLHIAPGEIYGFIGHNGAGKTTTLKSVVGILQFDQGEITIDGRSIKADPLGCKREMAYIPDNPDLYDYMTGIKYLNFIADVFGVDAQTRQARIRTYADAFELTGDLAQPIAAYSHGMKQKLSIIAAWLHDPKVIIMDEPFVGLDPKAAHLLKGMMREICDNGGAIFFSTHVLEVAEKLCDKVAIIKGGRLIRSGTMEEVKGDDSLEEVFLSWRRSDGQIIAEKTAVRDLPQLLLRREKEQTPVQGKHRQSDRAVCAADGGRYRRYVHAALHRSVRSPARGRSGLAVLHPLCPGRCADGRVWQRVQHVLRPVPLLSNIR